MKDKFKENELDVVLKYPDSSGKIGLDIENGMYYVAGGVTFGHINLRPVNNKKGKGTGKGNTSRFAKLAGFKIYEFEMNSDKNVARDSNGEAIVKEEKYVTKEEAIYLATYYGMQNVYVDSRNRKEEDSEGKSIYNRKTFYLSPYPRTESFFREGRGITAYELNSEGKIKYPVNLLIKEEECSKNFWRLLELDYNKKKLKKNNESKNIKKDNRESLKTIKLSLDGIVNPFKQ